MKNVHEIKITVEKEEWNKILDDVFKKKNQEVTIQGFRKGKAPKDVFIKNFGIESLYTDGVDKALSSAYEKVLKDNNLEPVCEPSVEIIGIDEEHLELSFKIITKPEVKLSSYKKLGVKPIEVEVTDEEVEEEINHMRSHFAEIIVKENGEIASGDTAVIDFEGFVDGVAFEGGKGEDYALEIGSNTFVPGFEEQLIGAKKGDKVDVKVTFPEDYVENLKGKEALFKVTVKEVKMRVLPEINEDFFADLNYDDVKTKEDLEKKTREHILEHKKADAENEYIDKLIEAGIEKMTVEINDEIIDDEIHRMMHDLEHRMAMQGISLEQYFQFTGTTEEKFKEFAKPEAIKRIKSRYLLDEIISKEGLDASEEEVMEHAKSQALKYGATEDEIINEYGGMNVVKYDLLIHKAIDVLKG